MNRKNLELFILLILGTASFAVICLRIIFINSYLPETGGVSINVVFGIEQLLQTGRLYINPEEPPFSIIQYMPLHYHIVASLAKILNLQNSVHHVLMLNRTICLVFDICTTLILMKCISNNLKTIGTRITLAAGLLFFLLIPSIIFGRIDNLYLLLWIISIFNILIIIKKESSKTTSYFSNIIFVGISSSLALLTKQTAVFLAFYIFCFLLFTLKNKKATITYFFSATIPFLILIFYWSQPSTIDFKLNVVDGLKNGINLNWFFEVFVKNYFMKNTIIICTGIFSCILLLRNQITKLHSFIGFGILFYFLIALIFSLKGGSGPNYYLEFNILSIIGICILLNDNANLPINNFLFTAISLPLFLFACVNDKGWGYISKLNKVKKDYQICESVTAYIKKNINPKNYVLTAFHKENCLNLMLAPKAIFPCREVALTFTYPMGVFKFQKYKEMIDSNQIQYYIDEKDKLPNEILGVSLSSFKPDTTIGNYTIYKLLK